MTKISNQYSLTNILTADLANSRLGINNVSPTVALDVTGAGKFSGALTGTTATFSGQFSIGTTAPSWGAFTNMLNLQSGSIGGTSTTDFRIFQNMYYDGGSYRTRVLGASQRWDMSSGELYIYSAASAAANAVVTPTNKFTILNNGNCGIGTDSPATPLHVAQSNTGNVAIAVQNTNASYSSQLRFLNAAGTEKAAVTYVQSNGGMYFNVNTIDALILNSNGNVGIGNAAGTNAKLQVFGDVAVGSQQSGGDIAFYVSSASEGKIPALFQNTTGGTGSQNIILFQRNGATVGSITSTNTVTSYNVTSDYRLKEDLKEIKGLDKVSAIKVYDYKWKASDSRMDGVLAHELQEILPYAVYGEKDGKDMQGVDYSKLVPILIKAVQELSAKVSLLENK